MLQGITHRDAKKNDIDSVPAEMIKWDIMSPGLLLFWTEMEQHQKEENGVKGTRHQRCLSSDYLNWH